MQKKHSRSTKTLTRIVRLLNPSFIHCELSWKPSVSIFTCARCSGLSKTQINAMHCGRRQPNLEEYAGETCIPLSRCISQRLAFFGKMENGLWRTLRGQQVRLLMNGAK